MISLTGETVSPEVVAERRKKYYTEQQAFQAFQHAKALHGLSAASSLQQAIIGSPVGASITTPVSVAGVASNEQEQQEPPQEQRDSAKIFATESDERLARSAKRVRFSSSNPATGNQLALMDRGFDLSPSLKNKSPIPENPSLESSSSSSSSKRPQSSLKRAKALDGNTSFDRSPGSNSTAQSQPKKIRKSLGSYAPGCISGRMGPRRNHPNAKVPPPQMHAGDHSGLRPQSNQDAENFPSGFTRATDYHG